MNVPTKNSPITTTARVSRTWSSTKCSMTGIFLSSSGSKTFSCSHRWTFLIREPVAIYNPFWLTD